MQNRTPVPRSERPPLPDFAPVPRKYRHDGWTPERQKAFIEALADTGCVSRAAKQVNIAQTNAYALRRSAGAEGFRKAWDAALDFGVKRLKDIAFERAVEGYLVPVFVAGKLIGFRRKHNDALLMFCLRHYGQDSNGKRTTINYFSTRASAGASAGAGAHGGAARGLSTSLQTSGAGSQADAIASATTVRTVISGSGSGAGADSEEEAAALLSGFEGVALDPQAQAEIAAALEACALRAREVEAAYDGGGLDGALASADDPGEPWVRLPHDASPYALGLVPPVTAEDWVPFAEGEAPWEQAGAQLPADYAAFLDRVEKGEVESGSEA